MLGLGFAVFDVLRDGGLPFHWVVLVAFPVGGVVDLSEQARQRAAFCTVFIGRDVACRVGGFCPAAYLIVGNGGYKAACAGGFDG